MQIEEAEWALLIGGHFAVALAPTEFIHEICNGDGAIARELKSAE
jgi:hypothetical protein